MNIKRAKQELKDTIESYLLKDSYGEYVIPAIRQRPVLLLGAPGIGKTQIMEQIAKECRIALVSYTITHHTRQSAIGLPYIARKQFGGMEYSVTEYTMSEIVASVFEKMEKTGLSEGILFLDEVNCVSETLAPAMLQFLQCKTFGNHAIPRGWIIVAAGNPPEYNKSVREFDVVTLDRIKKIMVEPEFEVWKEYAVREQIHPAVISYLTARPSFFYKMETTVDGRKFATPRGWEDLSRILSVYEKLGKRMDREVVIQYIQHEKIAKDFANYLELFVKYEMDYQLEAVLEGKIDERLQKKAAHASFDERLSVTGLLFSRCSQLFAETEREHKTLELIFDQLKHWKELLTAQEGANQTEEQLSWLLEAFDAGYEKKKKAELLTQEEDRCCKGAQVWLEQRVLELKKMHKETGKESFAWLKEQFDLWQDRLEKKEEKAGQRLEAVFDFLEAVFGSGQEMVVFLSELNADPYSISFLQNYDCERYYYYNKSLLFEEAGRNLEMRIRELEP